MLTTILFFVSLIVLLALYMVNLDITSQTIAKDATYEFVDNVRASGKITPSEYRSYITDLTNRKDFKVELTVKHTEKIPELDGSGKPTGKTLFITKTYHNDEILTAMFPPEDNKPEAEFVLEKGDTITAVVRRSGAGFTSILALMHMEGKDGDRILNYSGSCYRVEG